MHPEYLIKEDFSRIFLRNIKNRKDKIFSLYIHSPFCVRQCKFCIHTGYLVKINGDLYKKYYEEYLPMLINFYKPVFLERIPDTVYFGGGSSSVMTVETMQYIFSLIPNFKDIKEKTFECNFLLLNENKIKILKDFNFTHISFGVQSFDNRILRKNNRATPDINKIKEMVHYLQSLGFYVNCDLMVFIDNKDESDINGAINDLIIMTKKIKPNSVTLYPERMALIEEPSRGIEKILALRKELIKNEFKFNGYILPQAKISPNFLKPTIENNEYTLNYIFHRSDEDLKKRHIYNSSGYPMPPKNIQSVLGIGSYQGSYSYSYIDDLYVEELNIDFRDAVYQIIR